MGMGAERVLDGFPGLLDKSDCSFDRGMCYVTIPVTLLAPMSLVVHSIGIPPDSNESGTKVTGRHGTSTGMCYYYLRHSGPFRLVLVDEAPICRKGVYLL